MGNKNNEIIMKKDRIADLIKICFEKSQKAIYPVIKIHKKKR
jgi:hypothetical protein